MTDLYPNEAWNFVFGQASLKNRTGVYSFARYDPLFWDEPRDENYYQVVLERSCKVMSHELLHQFGMHHCIYFQCILNGSNHLQESDSRGMHLCPVCYRKLHLAVGFDPLLREKKILEFLESHGLNQEFEWQKKKVKLMES